MLIWGSCTRNCRENLAHWDRHIQNWLRCGILSHGFHLAKLKTQNGSTEHRLLPNLVETIIGCTPTIQWLSIGDSNFWFVWMIRCVAEWFKHFTWTTLWDRRKCGTGIHSPRSNTFDTPTWSVAIHSKWTRIEVESNIEVGNCDDRRGAFEMLGSLMGHGPPRSATVSKSSNFLSQVRRGYRARCSFKTGELQSFALALSTEFYCLMEHSFIALNIFECWSLLSLICFFTSVVTLKFT